MSTLESARYRTGAAALLGLLVSNLSLATPPAAPIVEYSANVKQVILDWEILPRSNYYELWFKANNSAAPVKFDERRPWDPHWANNVAAHLLNWDEARWEVRACNFSGCSSSGLINIGSTIAEAVGFFHSPQPASGKQFASRVAISEDGKTIAANCGSKIYVFRRGGNGWRVETGFVPLPAAAAYSNVQLALSGDGNTLAIGMEDDRSDRVDPAQPPHGSVVVMRRTGSTWRVEQHFLNSESSYLGRIVRLSESGDTILFSQFSAPQFGGIYLLEIHQRSSAGWARQGSLAVSGTDASCRDFTLSGDGRVVVRSCGSGSAVRVDTYVAPTWTHRDAIFLPPPEPVTPEIFYIGGTVATNYDGTLIAARTLSGPNSGDDAAHWKPQVSVYRRDGSDYQKVATLAPSRFASTDNGRRSLFGADVAVSRDGGYVAVIDTSDTIGGLVISPPTSSGEPVPPRGAVYLFERRGETYALRRHVGVSTVPSATTKPTVSNVAFADNGRAMVVGEPSNRSNGTGPGDGRYDQSLNSAGAFWLY
ncbi:MAG TPA: hypothetical protein VK624_01810 [Steroidobacteraceae bacterium]|nr:hypothetical protein [Steroidobacteraceae bacterium]